MKKINSLIISILVATSALVALPGAVFGANGDTTFNTDLLEQLDAAAGEQGANLGKPGDPRNTVIYIIRFALSLIGMTLLIINIYAGFLWMTAGGNSEQVEKAQSLLRNGVIGLIIVLSSYAITIFAANIARGYSFYKLF